MMYIQANGAILSQTRNCLNKVTKHIMAIPPSTPLGFSHVENLQVQGFSESKFRYSFWRRSYLDNNGSIVAPRLGVTVSNKLRTAMLTIT